MVADTDLSVQHQGKRFAQWEIPRLLVTQLVVFDAAARKRDFAGDVGLVAARRPVAVVRRIAVPAHHTFIQPVARAVRVHEMLVAVRRVVAQFHPHIFHAQADIDTVVLGDWYSHCC